MAEGYTVMLYKKKDPNKVENYRPITLLNHIFKITTKIINQRIAKIREKAIMDCQCVSGAN